MGLPQATDQHEDGFRRAGMEACTLMGRQGGKQVGEQACTHAGWQASGQAHKHARMHAGWPFCGMARRPASTCGRQAGQRQEDKRGRQDGQAGTQVLRLGHDSQPSAAGTERAASKMASQRARKHAARRRAPGPCKTWRSAASVLGLPRCPLGGPPRSSRGGGPGPEAQRDARLRSGLRWL